MKAGSEIVPDEQYRIRSEDIYKPKQESAGPSGGGSTNFGAKGGSTASTSSTMSTAPVLGGSHGGEEFGEDYNP